MEFLDIIRSSSYFDRKFYLNKYLDVINGDISPEEHYLSIGCFQGRDPSSLFSTIEYYKYNKDVFNAKVNPLVHYEQYGKNEDRYTVPVKIENEASDYKKTHDSEVKLFFSVVLYISKSNSEYDVRTTLDSLFSQTNLNFEILIIDGGSSNFSYNVIFEYLTNSAVTSKLLCPFNNVNESDSLSFGSSLKEAINLSSGRYIIFLRSGDFFCKDHVNILTAELNDYAAELVTNNVEFLGNINDIIDFYEKNKDLSKRIPFDKITSNFYYHFSALCVKKDVLNNINFVNIFSMSDLFLLINYNISNKIDVLYIKFLKTIVKVDSCFKLFSNFKNNIVETKNIIKQKSDYGFKYLIDQKFLLLDKRMVIGNAFINTKDNLVNDMIDLAEYLCFKKEVEFAIKVFYFIYNQLDFKVNNILYRIFDCYISLHELHQAENVLLTIVENNPYEQSKLNTRKDILNSSKAMHYNVSISESNFDMNCVSHLVSNNQLLNYKASDLLNIRLEFSNPGIHFSSFVVENINYKRENIVHNNDKDDVNGIIVIDLNLLNARKFGIASNNEIKWLFTVSKEPVLGVIRGNDNWLFLDNDSNESVSQYVGKRLVSDFELNNWKLYLDYVKNINNYILVIPPSKEQVFPQYYPYERSNYCPIDQFLCFIKDYNINLCYPLGLLQNDATSYVRTETHWSYKSAFDVFYVIMDNLKIDYSNLVLPNVEFKLTRWVGDLGSKCYPLEFSDYYVIDSLDNQSHLVFRNFIASRQGKICKFHNDNAVIKKKIIVFGDSFSTILEPFLASFFADVILVWSNATIIEEVINFEQPDFIIAEITERFLVRSPLILHNIVDYKPCLRPDLPRNDIDNLYNFTNSGFKLYDEYANLYKSVLTNK